MQIKTKRQSSSDLPAEVTRLRLLNAAGEVFADVGFERATIRQICERAKANVSAVKYHFGDKYRLYQAVFIYWFGRAHDEFPVDMGQASARTGRERLRAFVHMMLCRLLATGKPAWHGKLIAREMTEPTGVLDHAIETMIRPTVAQLHGIVHEIVGDLPPKPFERALLSVIAQCVFYQHARPVLERVFPEHLHHPDIDALADHITTFSHAGLVALRNPEGPK